MKPILLRMYTVVLTMGLLAGCNNNATDLEQAIRSGGNVVAVPPTDPSGSHGHEASNHGGIIVAVGLDNYHAEAVFEKGGVLRLYTLGNDESRILEVDTQELTAYIKRDGSDVVDSIVLKAEPVAGDAEGKTSQFVGILSREQAGQRLDVTIPNIKIGSENFRLSFKSFIDAHEQIMPGGAAEAEARQLYLTPGGLYTDADIKANGPMTAAEKFKGLVSRHDMNPKTGERICPVTRTKANQQFTWIVGGQAYEFCCPPCVDEFVNMAKTQPEMVKDPEYYRK